MGYRSTFITEHCHATLPEWIKEKYEQKLLFPTGTLIATKKELPIYDEEIFEDIQKALVEIEYFKNSKLPFGIVVMGEDLLVSKVLITDKDIKYVKYNDNDVYFHDTFIWMF